MQAPYYSNSIVSGTYIRDLSVLKPWKSMLAIIAEWLTIIVSIYIHNLYLNIWLYIPVWFIISTRLYAMYSLLHDAIHYSISRNKKLNDFIGQVFLGFPIFVSLEQMRKNHLNHHKFLQSENDPEIKHLSYDEFHFPKSKLEIIIILLKDLSGYNFIKYKLIKLVMIFKDLKKITISEVYIECIQVVLILFSIYLGFAKELILYWIIPYATLYQVLNRIRLSTEHFNIDEQNYFKTRSVIPSFFEKWFLTPYNLGYHLEHHLYPSVPFYNLPQLHNKLTQEPYYASNAIIQKSYLEVFKDCLRK